MLAVAGLIAAVLLGGVVAAFVVTRGGGGTVEQTTTAVAAVPSPPATTSPTSTPAQSATPARSSTPQGPLLLSPGQQKSLPGVQSVEFALSECPGVKTVLQPTSIRMEQGGRVAVAYTVSVPRVQGVECLVDYPRDAQCSCMVLQTRLGSGRTIEARNTGGAGVSATGADDIYGAAPVAGEWWWDRGVDMDGDELSLLRLGPGTDVPLFRIPLLRQ